MLIFDVDGVLTDLYEKKGDPRVLDLIANELNREKAIAFITGRQYEWLEQRILSVLKHQLNSLNSLQHLFIACENGVVIVIFNGNIPNTALDHSKVITDEIKERVKIKTKEFQNIFFDTEKKAMISVEIKDGLDEIDRELAQKNLDVLQAWIKKEILPQNKHLEALRNPLAIDILYKSARKTLAVAELLKFIQRKNLKIKEFIVFGDNPSDSSIADELFRRKLNVQFVYVGKSKLPKKNYPIITAKNKHYALATLEILNRIKQL